MKKYVSLLMLIAALVVPWASRAQVTLPYSTGFEAGDDVSWTLVNDATNVWHVGSAAHHTGSAGLYITNNSGTSNDYTNSATQFSYAYREFTVTNACQVAVSFDWKANGEGNYDYLRAWIAPATGTLTAAQDPEGGTSAYNYRESTPTGWTDLGGKMNLQTSWQTTIGTASIATAGTYRLVFMWANDGSGGTTPPAAIDNVVITELTCPQPTNLAIAGLGVDGGTVTWTPGGTESEWVISLNGSDWESVYDTTLILDTLSANTPYTLRVRAVCGSDDTSLTSTLTFRTTCAELTTLPFSENFDGVPGATATGVSVNNLPPCWDNHNVGTNTSYSGYPIVYNSSSYAHSGSQAMRFYNYITTGSYADQYAILPPTDSTLYPVNSLMVSFWMRSNTTSYNSWCEVGVMTNAADASTFVPVDTIYTNSSTTYASHDVYFNTYNGPHGRVAFKFPRPATGYNYGYVDDIVMRVIPTCFWPTAVTLDSVSSSDAIITWTPDSRTTNPGSWEVEYGLHGFTPGTGTMETAYDTTITLTNLDPNTQYDIYISADCSGDVSDPAYFSFRTACGLLTTLPFTENFDGVTGATTTSVSVNNLPPCWNYHNVGTNTSYSGYPIVYNSSSYAHSGSQAMRFYNYTTAGSYADQYGIMPMTDSTLYPLTNLMVGFWMRANSTSYNSWCVVGVMTDPTNASSFVPVQTVYTNSSTTYAYHEVSFENYTGPHGYVTFKFSKPTSGYNYGYVDDVTLRELPTCFWPSTVALQTVGSDAATIEWTPDSRTLNPDGWNVEYGPHGFTRGNGTTETVTTTSISLTGLTPNTEYDIYVSADCGNGDESDATLFTFRTECTAIATLPYTQDFESATTGSSTSATFVSCMHRLNNGSTYFGYPFVSSTSGYNHTPGGSKGIYWYLTTTTGTYGDYEYVVMPGVDVTQYPMNTLQVRFWARATSTSYSPVFQVGVMTNPTDVNTFQLVETVNVGTGNTTYTEFTVAFGNYTGQGQYIAIRALRPSSSWYATMDDITIEEMPSCPAVTDLDATATVGAAMLTWDYQAGFDAPASYEVTYDSIGGTNPTTVTATDANALLTGLSANTTYKAYVRADCGSDGFGRMDSITFTTKAFQCNEMLIDTNQTLTVNFSTSSSGISGCIAFSSWGNTAYQTVYTAAELTAAGLTPGAIIGIDLGFTGCTTYAKEFSIYIKSTTTSSISNATMEAPGTLVYGPANHPMNTSGWQHYNFTTPFEWDGTSNIMITTFMNQPTGASHSNSTGLTGYYVSATNKARYRYQDGTQWTTSNLTSGNAGSTYSYRAAIHFTTYGGTCIDMATCAEPVLMVADKTASSVTLAWVPGAEETAWDIAYREQGTTTWTTAATGVTTTTYTVTNLSSGTDYDFRLSFDCPADSATYTDIVSTRTPCTAISIPYTYGFENMVAGSNTIRPDIPCWSHLNNGSTYFGYPYGSTTTPHSGMTNLYWYLTTTTGTYGDYQAVVLPPVDTTINPINTLQFTFWARPSSTSYAPVFLVGVMTDPDDINTFETVSTVNVPSGSTDWSFHEVSLNSYHGNGKYVALRANRPSSSWYAYTDDITLETLPTCPHVTNIHATQTGPDSIMLAWTPGGTEVEWEVSYGDTSVIVLTNSYLAENLSPSSIYTFSVRAICTAGDTSRAWEYTTRTACGALTRLPYVQDFEQEATTSSSSSTFVPCWGHYNNGTSNPGYPYLSATASYNHTPGGSKGLYWYGSTTTGTYGDYYIISLPPVDTTVYPVNTLQLTFWARPTSTSYSPVFYVGVLPENATTNQLADSLFQYCDTIMIDHSTDAYKKYTTFLDNFTGTGNRIAIRANRPSSAWYATMDDITLDVIPACAAVEDVTVVSSPASAIVSWTVMGRNYSGATVEYRDTTTSTWTTVMVSGASHAVLTGLTPSMPYTVRVTAICPEGPSATVTAQFSTINFACTAVDTTTTATGTLGTGTSQTTGVPVTSAWGNTLCQSIYLASELQDLGLSSTITSITYTWTSNTTAKHFSIYMTNTTATEFTGTSTTNWQPTGAATLVYSGPHPVGTSGSVTYQLTTPFEWDGSSNICVTTTMNQPTGVSQSSSGFYGLSTQTAAYRSLYKYQDSNPIDGSNPASVTPNARSQYRPNVTFTSYGCAQHTTCAAPIAHLANIDATTATVVWAPGNLDTAWNIYYRVYGDTAYTQVATATTARSYTFTGLASGSMYEFMVENTCGSGYTATVSGSTDCVPIAVLPYTETFDNWGSGTGVLPNCWDRTGTYSTYTYLSPTRNHGHGAGASVYMYEGTSTSQSWLILPAIDTSLYMANQLQVAFYATYTQSTYSAPTFAVGVMTDPTDVNTFVPIDTVTHTSGYNHWDCFEVPLASYTDSGAYIAIRTLPVTTTTYPYIDDVTIELIPTCMRPDSLYAANATTSSVDVGWRDRANASQWIVEYGPVGFIPGTGAGTTLVANTNPVTISGLPVAYVGEFYVKAVCGGGDTGYYSREPYGINTLQIPATVPYFYDFEDPAEWGNWQTSSNSHTNNWFRGTAVADSSNYSIYVSADAGATYKPYIHDAVVNAAAYRDVNFGNVDTSFTISFRARVGGTIEQNYDGLMVFLIDPSLSTVPSNMNITSPWGNVNDLYRITTVRRDTVWDTYTASFDTISGVKRVAFFWFNQNTQSYTNLGEPAAVDNLSITYSSCPRPLELDTVSVNGTTVMLTWDGDATGTYQITYRPVGGANRSTIVTGNQAVLSNLNALTTYNAWVRKVCGVGDTSLYSDGISFATGFCTNAYMVRTDADSTVTFGTSYNAPVNNFYNYTLTETIIDSAELGGARELSTLAYYYSYTSASTVKTNVDIWIQPTNKSVFSSSSDMVALDTTIAVRVYHGNLNCSNGWNYFGFSTPYNYNGRGNLLVIVDDNSGDYDGSANVFNTVPSTGYKTITYYSDSDNPVATSPASFSGSKTYYQWRPRMLFVSCGEGCATPGVTVTDITHASATLTAIGNGLDYELAYGTDPDNLGTPQSSTTGVFNLTGLANNTEYFYEMRQQCESGNWSSAYSGSFNTANLPCTAPSNLSTTNVTYTGATLTWTPGNRQTTWEVHLFAGSTVNRYDTVTNPTFTYTDLVEGTTYNMAVRGFCTETEYSDWSDTLEVTTLSCEQVTDITVSNITATGATLSWPATGAESYTVEYGYQGMSQGDGTSVTVNTNTCVLTGLDRNTHYDAYVRGNCSGAAGVWSAVVSFTTTSGGQGILDADVDQAVVVYPNPASELVTITAPAASTVTLVDLNGRQSGSWYTEDGSLTIDVSDLAKGAYFVRVTTAEGTAVRKLIVK